MDTHDSNQRRCSRDSFEQARWIPALILIAIGAAFLLNNLHIIPFHELFQYWPVVLIAVGLFRLVDSSEASQRTVGGVLIVVGAVLLAGTLGLYSLSWNTIWPLVLIAAGVLMLVQRLSFDFGLNFDTRFSDGPVRNQWLRETAVFSGGKRRIRGDFKGGKLDCIFGGFDVNLRQATMSADSVVLEINAVFGGAEVKVPEGWEVVMKGVGVFGGYGDETSHPNPSEYPNPKRLIMKGAAVFGGINVKN
jgi:predicted membrane protein